MKLPDQPSDQHHETGHLPTKGVYRTYFTCEYLPVYKHADLEYRNDALRCAFTGKPIAKFGIHHCKAQRSLQSPCESACECHP